MGEESRDIDGRTEGLGTLRWKTLRIRITVRGWRVGMWGQVDQRLEREDGGRGIRGWRGEDRGKEIRDCGGGWGRGHQRLWGRVGLGRSEIGGGGWGQGDQTFEGQGREDGSRRIRD